MRKARAYFKAHLVQEIANGSSINCSTESNVKPPSTIIFLRTQIIYIPIWGFYIEEKTK